MPVDGGSGPASPDGKGPSTSHDPKDDSWHEKKSKRKEAGKWSEHSAWTDCHSMDVECEKTFVRTNR